jgi:hypothetical protein
VEEADAHIERAGQVGEVGRLLGERLDELHALLVVLPTLPKIVRS